MSTRDVEHVARLARLKLEEQELEKFVAQLDDILNYVRQLQAVDTSGVAPTSHVLPLANITRPDQVVASLAPEEILRLAPARHGQLFKVPKIIE